jgi:hypothetical protein
MNDIEKSAPKKKFDRRTALQAFVPGVCMFTAMNSLIMVITGHHTDVILPAVEMVFAFILPWLAFFYLIGLLRDDSSR